MKPIFMPWLAAAVLAAAPFPGAGAARASAEALVSSVYTRFDAAHCRHTRGRDAEGYGSWRCRGHAGIDVVLSAGDQRMRVSFGSRAHDEAAAGQTFPAFNNVYRGTVEWRLEHLAGGRTRPFAAIVRWSVRVEGDEEGRNSTGRVLVVTRLNPGGVCHVGYVDARSNADANELARQIADRHARTFRCGTDKPIVLGRTMPGLAMPTEN